MFQRTLPVSADLNTHSEISSTKHLNNIDVRDQVVTQSKTPAVSVSKKLNPHCLVLVGSKGGFERDLTTKLK